METLANIFGFLGIGSTIFIYQQKNRFGLLMWKLISNVFWLLHYWFLGAFSGVAVAAIGVVRELVFVNRSKKWAKHHIWLFFFLALSLICGILTWKNIFSLFTIIASAVSVIGFWIGSPKLSRKLAFPISICMLTYDISSVSIAGIINELFTLISSLIGYFRYEKRKDNKK